MKKNFLIFILFLISFLSASANNYEVGDGKMYSTLDDLRAANITWADGDIISIYNDDHSLLETINFGDKDVTISGQGSISLLGLFNVNTGGVLTFSVNNNETITIAGSISGDGSVTQNSGTIHLAAKASIGGTFTQTAGTLTSENNASLENANFKGTVTPTGTLKVATASFNGATLDLSGTLGTNKIVATGNVTFEAGANKTTINLGDLSNVQNNLTYALMQGQQISRLDQIDINVTLGDIRGGLYLADGDQTLIFGLITGNTTLTWIGIGATLWNTTETNTNWDTGNFRTYFKNGDNVVFNNIAVSKDVEVAAEGVAPANMTISSTGYEFTGGAISSSGILSVNENTTFKNQFNSTGGVTIADGKTLTLNNTADQMLSSVLSGNGAITKNGTGTLTLSGNSENFGGTFIQNAGTIHLATKASLGGTFTQNVGALTSESGAALNTANFKGTVTPIGTLNVDTASFNGATLDLSGDLRTNKISATGKVTFAAGANETTIKLGDLSSASSDTYYILMQGSQISGLDQINIDVTLGGIRGGLYLADEDKTLIFGLITGNTTLTWTGIGATLWNTTETNTNWYTDNFRTYFKNGDNVVFNNIAVSKDVEVAAEGVEPANMTISSTGYEFTGGAISSSDILSVNENTTFNNPFHSTGGVTIANGKTLIASDLDLAGSLDIKTGGTCSISGNATLADGSTIAIDLTGTSAANPALTVGGTFDIGTLGTEKFNLNIIFSGTLPTGTYTLINGGTFDFTGRATANLPAGAYFKTDILGKLMLVVPPSSDATLLSLTLSESGLSPEFNATITEYSLSVGNDVQIITILATANSEKAEVGGDTGTWTLDIGENVFKVIVTAENGAIETYTITIIRADNTVGIVDVGAAEDVSVYPNPTKGIVYIKTKNGVIPEVSVFSSTGNQLMFKQKCTQIDLTSFTKGLYILLIDEKPVKVIRK